MEKRARALVVDVVDGEVQICEPSESGEGGVVRIPPEQVDQIIDWLKEKREEALKQRAEAERTA
jgi:hypothetical protein